MNKLNKVLFTKLYLSTLFVCSFFLLQAQVWSGNVDTNWNNPANWSNNQVPTSGSIVTVPGSATNGNFPVFEGNPIIDYTIQNAGVITFNSFVFNTGTIINYNVGQLVSNSFFVNAGKVVFDNDGSFDNNGVFESYGEFDNAASAVFNNNSIFNNYGIFTNFGNFNNVGTFTNVGSFSSTRTFTNDGNMTNLGKFDNALGGTYHNNAGATVQNNNGASFISNGVFNNASTLQNDGEVLMQSGATLNNTGNVTNNLSFINSGAIYNNSTFQNNGTLRNNDAAFLENNDVIQNNGTIDHGICAKLVQQANNTIGGTVENNGGLIYVLAGAVNVTSGELGFEFTDLNQTAPPIPGCKSDVEVSLDETGVVVLQLTDVEQGSFGICGAQIIDRTIAPTTFGIADIGQQVVTLSVTDEFNLVSTCDAFIQIAEYVAPLVAVDDPNIDMSCPNDITLTTLPGANSAVASWTEPTGTTNCAITPPPSNDCSNTPSSFPNTIYMGEYNGSKYFCSQYNLTYSQGRQLASQMGGYLAVINDATENEYIRSHIMASSAWIGYSDEASEGNYLWEASQSSDYINWDAGQPNNYGGDEDYARILQSNGKWTDRDGNVALESVIEIPCGGVNCTNVNLNLVFDNYAEETSWDIQDANGTNVAWGGYYGNHPNGGNLQETVCLLDGCYSLTIYDSYGDGMCCTEGNGSYALVDSDGNTLASGGEFVSVETTNFCIETSTGGSDELVIEQIEGQANGTEFSAGTTQVAYRGTDDCGNEEICLFEVTVNKTPSTITANCPTNIIVDAPSGAGSAVVTWTAPTATSDCYLGSDVTIIRANGDLESGDAFPVGTTFIGYTLKDNCDRSSNCSFFIAVNELPAALTLLSCPQDLTAGNPISWTAPTATTTCFTNNVIVRQIEGPQNGSSSFPEGVSRISYLVSDDCGNVEVCTFLVTNDGSAPTTEVTIACREDLIINVPAGSGGGTVTLETANASTTCADSIVTVSQTSGPASDSFFPVGTYTITYEATDNCGNTATCSYDVTMIEEQGTGELTIYCPDDQIGRALVGDTLAVVNWTAPTATTTCSTSSNVVITQTDGLPSGSEFPLGTSMVTFQATDDCGNVETCTFKIMVTNEECNIEAIASNVLCDDNGTPDDPSDDTFTFDLLVTGVGNPWGWTGGGQTVAYDEVTEFGPYNISDGIAGFTVTDTDNATCSANISVDAPAPCSNGGPTDVCNNDILFVVGNTTLNNGDLAAKARMESLNFNVTVIDDNVVETVDGENRGLIIISSTTHSGAVNTKFTNIAVPVFTWEAWLFDDMNMTASGTNVGYGKFQYDSRTVMNEESHPIAAGLTSLVEIFTTDRAINWGRPSEEANIISCLPGDETKVMVFAYEKGKEMIGLTAPARRVGFFLRNSTPQHMTAEGWMMFDAAIIWAAGCTPTATQELGRSTTETILSVENKEQTTTTTTTDLNIEMDNNHTTTDFSVFPNPASDYTQVDLKAFMGENVNLFIYNQNGQLVQQKQLNELGQAILKLNVSTLQSGMHTIRVVADGRVVAKKLLITRTF